jgi:predicted HTH transcriptional regulator
LRLLKAKPQLTGKQAAEQLGVSQRGVEKQLAKLKATGRIARVGPNKGGHWQVSEGGCSPMQQGSNQD